MGGSRKVKPQKRESPTTGLGYLKRKPSVCCALSVRCRFAVLHGAVVALHWRIAPLHSGAVAVQQRSAVVHWQIAPVPGASAPVQSDFGVLHRRIAAVQSSNAPLQRADAPLQRPNAPLQRRNVPLQNRSFPVRPRSADHPPVEGTERRSCVSRHPRRERQRRSAGPAHRSWATGWWRSEPLHLRRQSERERGLGGGWRGFPGSEGIQGRPSTQIPRSRSG